MKSEKVTCQVWLNLKVHSNYSVQNYCCVNPFSKKSASDTKKEFSVLCLMYDEYVGTFISTK